MIIRNAAELFGFEQSSLTFESNQNDSTHMFIRNELPLEQKRSKVFFVLSGIVRSLLLKPTNRKEA